MLYPAEEAIFKGKSDVMKKPGLVKKEGLSMDKCAKACLEEKTIKCQFFKFVNSSKMCYLSESDDRGVAKSTDKITMLNNVRSAETKERKDVSSDEVKQIKKELKQLHKTAKKLKNVEKKVSNLKKFSKSKKTNIHNLKKQNNREEKAIINLQNRIHMLAEKLKHLKDEMGQVQKEEKSMFEITESMKASDMSFSKGVKKVLTQVFGNDVKNNAAQITNLNKTVQQDLQLFFTNTKTLDERIDELLKEIKSGKYDKGMNEKAQTDQVKIAKRIAKVSSRDKRLKSKVNKLEKDLSKTKTSFEKTNNQRRYMLSGIGALKQTLQNLKTDIDKEADPLSKKNREWQTGVNTVKNAVTRLAEDSRRLNEDLKNNKNDVTNIIKESNKVKLGIQNMKSEFGKEKLSYAKLQQEVNALVKNEAKFPKIIHMTKMSTNILKTLSDFKDKENDQEEKIEGFIKTLKGLATKVSNNENVAEKYKKVMQRRQKQLKYLNDTIKDNEEKLLIVSKHIVPKEKIIDLDNKVQKVEHSLTMTQKAAKSLKQDMKTVKASAIDEMDRHLNSKIRKVHGSFSKTVKSLRSNIKTAHQEVSKLSIKVKKLQHRNENLSKEMKNQKKYTTEDTLHIHKKKSKTKILSKNRVKRSYADTDMTEKEQENQQSLARSFNNLLNENKSNGKEETVLSKVIPSNISNEKGLSNTESPNVTAGRRRCPQGYDLHGLHCYKLIRVHLTYDDAKRRCEIYNGKINFINSQSKQTEILHFTKLNKFAAVNRLWMSAMEYDSEKQQFHWDAVKTQVLYDNYHAPHFYRKDTKAKRCNIFNINMNGAWIGYLCSEKEHSSVRLPAICEISAMSYYGN